MNKVPMDDLLSLFEMKSEEEWCQALFKIAGKYGFNHTLFGMMPSKASPFEQALIHSNYPQEWRVTYDTQELYKVDLTVKHCFQSNLPLVWQQSNFQGSRQGEFYEHASGFGLRSGLSFPIHGSTGELGMLSFVSSERNHVLQASHLEMLANFALIRDYAAESAIKLLKTQTTPQIQLTARELECIKWIMAGKSSWEISKILSRSEATVNFHIANLMKKFKVNTRQQVVVKAIHAGLVVPA